MKRVDTFPWAVRHVENAWIPLRDGCRLAARMWIPEGAEHAPVPAILEYIPYRKRDHKRNRDQSIHAWFAGHGYACIRVDMRGSGDSDGVLLDEYLQTELDDGVEILSWIAAQPWCDGNVGMIGISWGGFNGLQIAAMQPPELRAVISVASTDDRYADDVHYMGGCLLGDNLSWASVMFARNSCPPDPEIVGSRWRDMWFERLEANRPWLETWMSHPHRDEYWEHGSVAEDISRIKCPVMAVSGWADGYSNAVFRLMETLESPRLGLIGPWSHLYPHEGVPGPAIGFLQEARRFWDFWLKKLDTGIMDEPMLRVYVQDSTEPAARMQHRPGRWVGEPGWPTANVRSHRYRVTANALEPESRDGEDGQDVSADRSGTTGEATETPEPDELSVRSPLSIGLFAGKWCAYGAGPDLPYDQREDDGGALVFDGDPLEEPLELLGAPVVDLELSVDRPVAMVAARLSDIGPDDKATRVTYGVLNLCHRDSHAEPQALEPGAWYRVPVVLNGIGHRFLPGHRLRLAISTSYWPLAWAPPEPVRLTIRGVRSVLDLPVRTPRAEDSTLTPFSASEAAPAAPKTQLQEPYHNWRVIRDLSTDESTLEVTLDEGSYVLDDIDLMVRQAAREWYRSSNDDFTSLRGETRWTHEFVRDGWRVRTETRQVLTCDATTFYLHAQLDAYEGENRVFSRNWTTDIPRRLV
ncbi:CocE/NonD family hydrolase [Phytoactinopolyspora halophila]|uniref:CocE/NonD family hydrolase n=1 Tax=Phytoactinopolyspora halophila TaxID=1981511 RepID=UPI003CCC81CB